MLSPVQRVLASALRQGSILPTKNLIDVVYGSQADGGPDDAAHVVRTQIHKMRAKLSSVGIEIETVGKGRGATGYRVRPDHLDRFAELVT